MNIESTRRSDCKLSLVEGVCDPNVCGRIAKIAKVVWSESLSSKSEQTNIRAAFIKMIDNCRNTVGLACLSDPDFEVEELSQAEITEVLGGRPLDQLT